MLGYDLHARQQTIAIVDTETGEFTEKVLCREGSAVGEFSADLEGPLVGIGATGVTGTPLPEESYQLANW